MEDAAVDRTASTSAVAAIENPVEDRTSVVSIVCRICFDDTKDESLITPCLCKGTVAFVHKSCLGKWLSEANTTVCELCHHVYDTEQVLKYITQESLWQWVCHRCRIVVCGVIAPLPIIIAYHCLPDDDDYDNALFMTAIILVGYYTSLIIFVIEMHNFDTSPRLPSNFGSSLF